MRTQSAAKTEGKARRTQEERSTATRNLLLDATIDCLVDLGHSATTTKVIADRAGVSRGAQMHHYPTKAELVSAALSHLARKLGRELTAEAARIEETPDRVSAALDTLWARFDSRLFVAWLELWVAARTDSALRKEIAPLEERIRRAVARQLQDLFGDVPRGHVDRVYGATMYLIQGMALERAVGTGSAAERKRNQAAALQLWKQFLTDLLSTPR